MKIKTISYNLIIFFLLLILLESFLGHWFTKDNFGIHMREKRNKNWKTVSNFNNVEYKFFYKRNFYGFRGEEFDPKDVKIIFEGGSTSNQRYTPEELTIVGQLNEKFKSDKINIKIYNAATDGKTLRGVIYDFNHWFTKIKNFQPEFVILLLGVNERVLSSEFDEEMFDISVQRETIDKIKDYLKNNSFVYGKYKNITNKYFPKNTSGYFLDGEKLYSNFDYIGYKEAKDLKRIILEKDRKIILQLEKRLLILKEKFKLNKISPFIITQVAYDGLNDQTLFLINEKLKKFSADNNWPIIKLDELIKMEPYDFYDKVHTTPQGSKRIASIIYPYLKKIINNKN
tara:strand:- start:2081 stop:3106 length:1026 start_codon:yes stop_codon:yes gene_type:complete